MGSIMGAASLIGSAFGGSDGGDPASSQSSSVSGYGALPQLGQEAYDAYFQLVKNLGTQQANAFPKTTVGAPTSPFDSSELYALQKASKDPIKPVGFQEPFNQYQKSALTAWGEPDYSANALQPYINPYQQMVQDNVVNQINRQSALNRNDIIDRNSRLNSRAMGSSLGTQLAQNDEATNRLLADTIGNLSYQGYNQALGLRDNALQQQYASGNAIQALNQAMLGAANPQGQLSLNPQYMQASLLAPLFGAFPQSSQSQSTSTGPTAEKPNMLSRISGMGLSAFGGGGGGGLGGMFGF